MDALRNTQEGLFRIEDAKPEDVALLRTIVKMAWLELYPNETYGITTEDISNIDWHNSEGLERRRKEIIENRDTMHTWVVKDHEGIIAGFCKALKLEDGGEIDAMYVLNEFKGQGLGKKLMQKALE